MVTKRSGETRPLIRKATLGSSPGYESGGSGSSGGLAGSRRAAGGGGDSVGPIVSDYEAKPKKSLLRKILLPVCSVLLLLTATGNSICFKKMTNAMPNYPFFLMQVSTIVYIPTFVIIVETIRRVKGFNDETKRFPQTQFMTMALFDVISGVMTLFGGVYTKGTTQMLLLQGAIPITMLSSFLLLNTRYEWMQYTGALVILSGVFVVLSPKFFGAESAVSSRGKDSLIFNSIYFLANIPQSLSSVYKEIAFKDSKNLDIFYTQMWIAIYQALMGFFVLPLNSLSFLGSLRIPFNELGSALVNGFKCFLGSNMVVRNCYVDMPIPGLKPCDSCEGAWFYVVEYIFFNFQYNVFAILLIREGSAALLIIIMTLRLPLGNMAFYMPAIMGSDAQPFNSHDISGLLVILIGLVIYRIQRSPESTQSDAPFVISSVVTLGPGVAEPITSQVQRAPISMKRRVSEIRGDLYARLGLPPAPNFVDPETDLRRGVDIEDSSSPKRYSSTYISRTKVGSLSDSPVVGVSPVARSAPFYVNLRHLKDQQMVESEGSDEEEIVYEEHDPRGQPIP